MERGLAAAPVKLSALERKTLEGWSRSLRSPHALAQRAQMLLACTEGRTNAEVGRAIGVSAHTV